MGSKKHKKHHKRERSHEVPDRPEKRLKLVLKVGGSSASEHGDSPHVHHTSLEPSSLIHDSSSRSVDYHEKYSEKHKKSKKKKKKKSSDRDRDRHERKHKHHHHHSHDKRERRKRELEDSGQEEVEAFDTSGDPMLKPSLFGEDAPERPYREPRACTLKNRQGKSALQRLLDYLLKALEKKDPQQVFAWPVTDHIAPGYSSIITQPMDFSSMRQKIENNEYLCMNDFKTDLRLMCDNCMTYNRPETIYFKAAKKMLHMGYKMMTKEKLLALRNTFDTLRELTSEEMGFDLNDETIAADMAIVEIDETTPIKEVKKKVKPSKPVSKFEAYQDGLSPEEILAQAQKAANDAAAKLTLKRPNTKFGFLRQLKDGTTTLAVLNPDETVPADRKVTLEMLAGKLNQGVGNLAGFQEDKRNVAKTVSYLNYGSFSSYAPEYDSTFANLTKEESDLLYSAYGDETGFQYAESILNFSKNSDYVTVMVDSILDTLTNGEHSKAMKKIEEMRKASEVSTSVQMQSQTDENKKLNESNSVGKANGDSVSIDYDSLRSLADLGIDVSFLDNHEEKTETKRDIQKKLNDTSNLITSLQRIQHDRLSAKPPSHLSHATGPSTDEIQLATEVSENLKDLAKQTTPMDVTSLVGLRKAMGITMEPFFSGDSGLANKNANPPLSRTVQSDTVASSTQSPATTTGEPAADLESELQEFLDTGATLKVTDSPNHSGEPLVDETLLV